jgi:pimeloyl-ACP methyl ester carboxylesterase
VRCPTLLLQGDPAAGGLLSDEAAERALRHLARGERERMDGIGHPLHAADPEAVGRTIERFLSAHGAVRSPASG